MKDYDCHKFHKYHTKARITITLSLLRALRDITTPTIAMTAITATTAKDCIVLKVTMTKDLMRATWATTATKVMNFITAPCYHSYKTYAKYMAHSMTIRVTMSMDFTTATRFITAIAAFRNC